VLRSIAIAALAAEAAAQFHTTTVFGTSGACTGTALQTTNVAFSTACTASNGGWSTQTCTSAGFVLSVWSAAGCSGPAQASQTIMPVACTNGTSFSCSATGSPPVTTGAGVNGAYFQGTSCSGAPQFTTNVALNQCVPGTSSNGAPTGTRYTCSNNRASTTTFTNNACTGTGTTASDGPGTQTGCVSAGTGMMMQIAVNGCTGSGAESYAAAAGVLATGIAAVAALL